VASFKFSVPIAGGRIFIFFVFAAVLFPEGFDFMNGTGAWIADDTS